MGDGVTDDSAAFAAAWAAAIADVRSGDSEYEARTLYIPSGQYLITTNNILGANLVGRGTAGLTHYRIVGDGRGHSTIIFRPSVSGGAMYDQTLSTYGLMGFTMSDCSLELDNASNGGNPVHFIISKAKAGQASQLYNFDRVHVKGETTSIFLQLTGVGVNDDQISCSDMRLVGIKTFIYCI